MPPILGGGSARVANMTQHSVSGCAYPVISVSVLATGQQPPHAQRVTVKGGPLQGRAWHRRGGHSDTRDG
jgi:hypothetical protein